MKIGASLVVAAAPTVTVCAAAGAAATMAAVNRAGGRSRPRMVFLRLVYDRPSNAQPCAPARQHDLPPVARKSAQRDIRGAAVPAFRHARAGYGALTRTPPAWSRAAARRMG